MSDRNAGLPPSAVDDGTIEMFDYLRPALTGGSYTIVVEQEVLHVDGADVPPVSQEFVVVATGYSLQAGEVHSVYPPAGSTGDFGSTLAHVVLTTRTLPWERALPGLPPEAPWLALLLLAPSDLPKDDGHGTVSPLGLTTMSMGKATTPLAGVAVPAREPVESDNAMCQVIEIPVATFLDSVPSPRDLALAAHVRQVGQPGGGSEVEDSTDAGFFSVVISNQLPAPGTNVVHLVSLVGHEGLVASRRADAAVTRVRLVSLKAWTFTVTDDPASSQTFAGLAHGIAHPREGDRQDMALGLPFDADALVLPPEQPRSRAATRLRAGYTPLSHRLPSGETTFSWYRGPFAPAPVAPLQEGLHPFVDADSALVLDSTDGLLDISLATAWTLGRSLALADHDFAVALVRLRKSLYRISQSLLGAVQSGLVSLDDLDARKTDLLQQRFVQQHLLEQLSDGLVGKFASSSTEGTSPTTAEQPVAQVPADLSELLETPAVQSFLVESSADSIDRVAGWLKDLMLLNGVPFSYLVPHPHMLPPESVRFFTVDSTWIDTAVDGALRVGLAAGSTRDAWFHRFIASRAPDAARRLLDPSRVTPALSGLLLRSVLVSGWPGLVVEARQGPTPLQAVRSDRLAPDLQLCVFAGTPDIVRLAMPHQTLHFQLEDRSSANSRTVPFSELVAQAATASGGKKGSSALAQHLLAPVEQVVFTR